MILRALAIADAIVAAINDADILPSGIVAERRLLPNVKHEDLATLHVFVVPVTSTSEPASREALQSDIGIDVAVLRQTANDADSLVILAIADSIGQLLKNKTIDGAGFLGLRNEPLWDMSHLHELNQITAVTRLTYRDVA